MANLYLYRRVSSAGQVSRHGLTRQTDYFETYLAQHPEHTIAKTYDDEGVSGYKGHNLLEGAGLHSFLRDLDAGLVPHGSILVVEQLDRVTRQDSMTAMALFTRIFNLGVSIHAIAENRTYSKEDGFVTLITASVTAERAHQESEAKSKRIGDAWKDKLAKAMADGKPHGKNCPRWLKLSDDKSQYELIPERVEVVIRLFDLRLKGHGLSEIAKMMNAEGVPKFTPKRKNSSELWMPETVRDVLQSEQVYGKYRERVDYYPVIISYETFQQCQKTFSKGRGQQISDKTHACSITLLKGLLKCTECGRLLSLTGTKKNHRGNYRCSACNVGIPALRMETQIVGAALAWIPIESPDDEHRKKQQEDIQREVETLTTQRKALTRALRFIESDDEADEIEKDIKERSDRIGELESLLLELKLQASGNLGNVTELRHLDWKGSFEDRVKARHLIRDWLKLAGKKTSKIMVDLVEQVATIHTIGEFDGLPETVMITLGETTGPVEVQNPEPIDKDAELDELLGGA